MVAAYHEALLHGGVRDYGFDACYRDYRRAMLQVLQTLVVLFGMVKPSRSPDAQERAAWELGRVWVSRIQPRLSALQLPDPRLLEPV